jgi:four helix bundle protein
MFLSIPFNSSNTLFSLGDIMGRNFKNLKIYSLAYRFLLELYTVLPELPENELRNMYSQMQRAGTSIVLNIVEGSANRSNKVFLNHLQYSYGSAKEVGVLLMLCRDLSYIDTEVYLALSGLLEELKASLYRFMQSVDKEIVLRKSNFSFT